MGIIGPSKTTFVRDLKAGERVTSFFLVRQKQLEAFRDRTKGEFLTLMLADRTGQILARVWENGPAMAEQIAVGDVLKIAGDVEEYQGRTQLIVQKMRVASEDEFVLSDFLPTTSRNVPQLLAEAQAAAERINDPNLAGLVHHFYDDPAFLAQLEQVPATPRLHHAYIGGWLEHLSQVLALVETVIGLHPELNGDLLRTGALLLSAGKVHELKWGRDVEYTDEGRLLGHAVLGDEAVAQALAGMPDFPAELALRVRHMLISHRGRYEWGAPREPMTLEAIALHHIESLNTQIGRFRDVLANRRDGDQPWTGFNRLLGRPLYAGTDYSAASDDGDGAEG
jgi:3'-5' exoribonuclease